MSHPVSPKISPTLAERMAMMQPTDVIRAIVLLRIAPPTRSIGHRLTQAERKETLVRMKEANQEILRTLEPLFRRHGVKLLDDGTPLSFGVLPVEGTLCAIQALAESEHVKAIIPNQSVTPTP